MFAVDRGVSPDEGPATLASPASTDPRRPAKTLESNQQVLATQSWCHAAPLTCLRQVAIEAAFLAAAYSAVLLISGQAAPPPALVLRFFATYVLLSLAGRLLSDTLGDKMSITAMAALGSKTLGIMVPHIVTW